MTLKRVKPWMWQTVLMAVLSTTMAFSGQSGAQAPRPADVVQRLYREVVMRHPMGVPQGKDKIAIWPLLSRRLTKAFDTRNACDLDWKQQHPGANVEPYILKQPGVYEDGLFSGGDEEGYLNGAVVGLTKTQPDRSYLVYVNVWSYFDGGLSELRTKKVYRWQVAARVIPENGHFVVDDILLLKNNLGRDKSVYMSRMITAGCAGSHSIGD